MGEKHIIIGGVRADASVCVEPRIRQLLSPKNGIYANARSALYAITRINKFERVWLPAYLCDSVCEPFVVAGLEIRFYPVTSSLICEVDASKLGDNDAIVLIRYFGFDHPQELYSTIKQNGACLIEDLSHAFYADPNVATDYAVYSPRKYFAVPDGGIAVSNRGETTWPYQEEVMSGAIESGIEAIHGRALYDAGLSASREWYSLFQKAEASMYSGLAPMSNYSRATLLSRIDYDLEARRRVQNYQYLYSELTEFALLEGCKGEVPLGFPIVVQNRNSVRGKLFEHGIYPPVHWDIDGVVPKEYTSSHRLASSIMTLPCDGRYDEKDMARMCSLFKETVG